MLARVLDRLDGATAYFESPHEPEEIDTIVMATGMTYSYPFSTDITPESRATEFYR